MDDPTIVQLEHVGRTFQMGEVSIEVLKDVNLNVQAGELIVVVGPSGSGKTTMLNLIGGLDQPNKGRVVVAGNDLTDMDPQQLSQFRRERIGFVFQFYNLIPNLSAAENVMVATELVANPVDVKESLQMVGLEARLDHFPAQLSGGEQQRVAIARAIAKNPQLLLCDEPTGALDFQTGKRILGLLHSIKHNLGKTVIVITHNIAISQMADRVVRIRSGEIVEDRLIDNPLSPEEITW